MSRGADDVMAVLARERGRALTAYAYLLTGNMRDAEDLVQDALVKAFVRSRALDVPSAEGYVRRTMLTTYVDGYRRRRQWDRVRHLLARGEHADGPAEQVDARHDVQAALDQLSPQQRACVVLRYYDDLAVPDIAERLGLAPGTVKRYLSVAVGRLGGILGPLAPTAPFSADGTRVVLEENRTRA